MNVLSKQYTGLYHLAVFVLALAASILTNPQVVDLGWPWIGTAAQAVAVLGLILQRFTPIGDGGVNVPVAPAQPANEVQP